MGSFKRDQKNLSRPVIMLTAKAEETDQLTGFKLGANDYVTKPFSPIIQNIKRIPNLLVQQSSLLANNSERFVKSSTNEGY